MVRECIYLVPDYMFIANTPRMYKKRPLEYTDDKTLKRRKNLLPTTQYKAHIPNAIVIPADKMPSVTQAAMNQLEFNTAFSSQNNNTSKIGQFLSSMQVKVFAFDTKYRIHLFM